MYYFLFLIHVDINRCVFYNPIGMERIDFRPPESDVFPVTSCAIPRMKPNYSVAFDVEKYASRLEEYGMSSEEISGLQVEFGPTGILVAGTAREGKIALNTPLAQLIYEMGVARGHSSEGIEAMINREGNTVLMHETKHILDIKEGWISKSKKIVNYFSLGVGGSIGGGYHLLTTGLSVNISTRDALLVGLIAGIAASFTKKISYHTPINIAEHRARRFAKKHKEDESWQDIVRIRFEDSTKMDE